MQYVEKIVEEEGKNPKMPRMPLQPLVQIGYAQRDFGNADANDDDRRKEKRKMQVDQRWYWMDMVWDCAIDRGR
jgi:hypothetical protein